MRTGEIAHCTDMGSARCKEKSSSHKLTSTRIQCTLPYHQRQIEKEMERSATNKKGSMLQHLYLLDTKGSQRGDFFNYQVSKHLFSISTIFLALTILFLKPHDIFVTICMTMANIPLSNQDTLIYSEFTNEKLYYLT